MSTGIPKNISTWLEWSVLAVIGNTMPPRDPNDDDDEDEEDENGDEADDDPAVVREPDE
jgi:hypothetical protein